MCANYRPSSCEVLAAQPLPPPDFSYSEAYPGSIVPIVTNFAPREWVPACFGLIPAWAKDAKISRSTYNARSETVAEKPSFRSAWKRGQLCIIPADAIFEPCYESGKAGRWRIERGDGKPMGIAGLWELHDVAKDQRKVIYQQRNELLEAPQDIGETITAVRESILTSLFNRHIPPESIEEQWDIPGLEKALASDYHLTLPIHEWIEKEDDLQSEDILERILEIAAQHYQQKSELVGNHIIHQYERALMLHSLDNHWREHLSALDHLRQGIHLRGYAQKNPKQEYKREPFELFGSMLEAIKAEVTKILLTVQIKNEQQVETACSPAHPRQTQGCPSNPRR